MGRGDMALQCFAVSWCMLWHQCYDMGRLFPGACYGVSVTIWGGRSRYGQRGCGLALFCCFRQIRLEVPEKAPSNGLLFPGDRSRIEEMCPTLSLFPADMPETL